MSIKRGLSEGGGISRKEEGEMRGYTTYII
jgi:hypothetical protein